MKRQFTIFFAVALFFGAIAIAHALTPPPALGAEAIQAQ